MVNSYLSLYESEVKAPTEGPFDALATRTSLVERCGLRAEFDLVVIGGGIDAALIAHAGALAELRVLVLAEGGVGGERDEWLTALTKALKQRPLSLVRSLLAVRETMRTFPYDHLWGSSELQSVVGAGLGRFVGRVLCRLGRSLNLVPGLPSLNVNLFTREVALAARQEGACILSGVSGLYLEAEADTGCYRVGFTDRISGRVCEVRVGGVVLDPSVQELPPTRLGTRVKRAGVSSSGALISACAVREESGVFFINRRGPWDALAISRHVVQAVLKAGSRYQKPASSSTARVARRLPGCVSANDLERFRGKALTHTGSSGTIDKVIARWAGRVRYLIEAAPDAFEEISSGVLRGEIELAVMSDHAACVNEVIKNSLSLPLSDVSEAGVRAIEERLGKISPR